MTHTNLGPGLEFDSIRALLDVWGPVAQDIGDDAALLTVPAGMQLVVSTDATVEDVHFRRKWISAEDIGARGATAALSDLAAMGATPQAVLVSVVLPSIWREHLPDLARGIGVTVAAANAHVVGGNISRGGAFSCTFTVLGFAESPVRRSGGHVGDVLYVTGALGGPGAAVAAWERGDHPAPWALDRFVHPAARLAEGRWLAENGATAMIDISDGLAADARHLGVASNAAATLDPSRVPVLNGVPLEEALASGEEYELLVAIPQARAAEVEAAFRARFTVPFTRVGQLDEMVPVAGAGGITLGNSVPRVEIPRGHDHFSSG